MNPIIEKIQTALEDARQRCATADAAQLEALRIEIFGRKGWFPALSKEMSSVPPEERRAVGAAFNLAKNEFNDMLEDARQRLAATAEASVQAQDVTLPGRRWNAGRRHPIAGMIDDCVEIFRQLGFVVAAGPELEDVYHNFDALNTPKYHPSRDPGDTFYFPDGRLLRTQTSPVQIRVMENQQPPIRIVAPGRCFRRDTPDATHGMNFHQIEGLCVDKNVSLSDLKSVLQAFATAMFGPEVKIRMRPHFFPFTEPSVEYDFSCIICGGKGCNVCKQSGYLEIAGAGMVDPNVLDNMNLNHLEWSGYAFGMGIERLTMMRYRINDIRLLYENDVRFLEQFTAGI